MQKEGVVAVVVLVTMAALATFAVFRNKGSVWEGGEGNKRTQKRRYAGGGALELTPEENCGGPVLRKRKKRSVAFQEPVKEPVNTTPRITRSTNKTFSIMPNYGGGDCLFLCYEMAIKSLSVSTSVEELRGIVAESVGEDQFSVLKIIYDEAKRENEYTVLQDYNFMRGVETLEDLRKNMKTREYWGDEMAIRALEEASGISLCVVTKDQSNKTIIANKMDSGQTIDSKRNLIVLLENSHYQVIKYKNDIVLNWEELQEAKTRLVSIGGEVGVV